MGPPISILKVPEAKVAKNRLHLDVVVSGGRQVAWETRWPLVEAKVAEVVDAGATVLHVAGRRDRPDHVVLADPEGKELCVL